MTAHAAPPAPIDLPPGYNLVTLREAGDAFAHACRIAGEAGAGTFVLVRRFDLLEFAVVLEPDEPLAGARRAFIAGMAALCDAIAAHCPPDRPLAIGWPDAILFDGALIGGGRLGWPQDCAEDATPDWLVFAGTLVVAKVGAGDTGLTPTSTSFEQEGLDAGVSEDVAESFARHLMLGFDMWAKDGFAPIAESYLGRLTQDAPQRPTLDADGSLLVAGEKRPLAPALATPSWLDPETGTVLL